MRFLTEIEVYRDSSGRKTRRVFVDTSRVSAILPREKYTTFVVDGIYFHSPADLDTVVRTLGLGPLK